MEYLGENYIFLILQGFAISRHGDIIEIETMRQALENLDYAGVEFWIQKM